MNMTERWLKIIESSFNTTPQMWPVMFLTTCDGDTTTVRTLLSSVDAEEKLWLLLPSLLWGRVVSFVLDSFQCPSTKEVMRDPVITIDDQTYEWTELVKWFELGNRTRPLTGEALTSTNLFPNIALRKDIRESGLIWSGWCKEWYQPWYVDLIIRIKPFRLVFWSITDSW